MLNKAYTVLMRDDSRCKYDVSIGEVMSGRRNFGRNISGFDDYSTWNGPSRSQALFVDENACIGSFENLTLDDHSFIYRFLLPKFFTIHSHLAGCRDCVHHASKTFVMDESLGCARVKVQFGDDDQKIEVTKLQCCDHQKIKKNKKIGNKITNVTFLKKYEL